MFCQDHNNKMQRNIICLNESDYLSGTCSCMTVAAHIDIVSLFVKYRLWQT